MATAQLIQVAVFLAAAAIAAPLGRYLRMGAVLGYLAAGMIIGPYVLGPYYALDDVDKVLHFGEFGVVMPLFVIGLELRPVRLWAMRWRSSGWARRSSSSRASSWPRSRSHLVPRPDLRCSSGSRSPVLDGLCAPGARGEGGAHHPSRQARLLRAAVPRPGSHPADRAGAAFRPGGEQPKMDFESAALAILTIAGVIVVGRFLLSRLYRIVAGTGVREAMTASALLTVIGVALVMEAVGLSAALGAFIAGALLADSEYRHQIEADIAPFEGLLLAVFFIAVGMSIDLGVLVSRPVELVAIVLGLVVIKAIILYLLGRWWGLNRVAARRLGLVISQGGEFAFVLFGAGALAGVIDQGVANLLTLAVTLSMATTLGLCRYRRCPADHGSRPQFQR